MISQPSQSSLSNLPRLTISIVLSYLQQPPITTHTKAPHNRDAFSLLLTNKRFAFVILPLFRLPKRLCKIHEYKATKKDGSHHTVVMVEKYRFATLPIQDPRTLLDRLNTRRLRSRIVYTLQRRKPSSSECQNNYHFGRTIEELALEEWVMSQIHHADGATESEDNQLIVWPAHLELLQFSDFTFYNNTSDSKDNVERTIKFKKLFRLCGRKPKDFTPVSDGSWLPHCNVFGNDVILLSSYPRSGNTLMRTLLERTTSTITGSDTRPDRSLSIKLALEHDLVGEGLTGKDIPNAHQKSNISLSQKQTLYQTTYDPAVNIVKTHFPERQGWRKMTANRVILLVRNPYDAIDSYWNLCCTNTHTNSLDESVYTKYASKFESMSRHEIKVWCEFHYYWFDTCHKEGVPLLIVRYEDLILNPEKEMNRVMTFLNEGRDNDFAAFWKWRIKHATGHTMIEKDKVQTKCTASLGSYRPRSSAGGLANIGKSLRKNRYSEIILCHINDVAASLELERKTNNAHIISQHHHITLLERFGYDIVNQKFPSNFAKTLPAVDSLFPVAEDRKNKGSIEINTGLEIRSSDDQFGRAMTTWRRGETNNDNEPFPTIPR